MQSLLRGYDAVVQAHESALAPSFSNRRANTNRRATDMRLSRSAAAMQQARQEGRDALQKPLSRAKMSYDDPHWGQQSCQFFASVHALQQINDPALPRPMDLRMRCKQWQSANYALISSFLADTNEAAWQKRCRNYAWSGANCTNMQPGDEFTLVPKVLAIATLLRSNIRVCKPQRRVNKKRINQTSVFVPLPTLGSPWRRLCIS